MSNAVTNIDSVTPFGAYIKAAQECGMKAMAFSEHGSVMEWWHKKCAIEAAGMKYIHAAEVYLTEDLSEKVRDNYHCVLIARNYDGFLELNRMISKSFNRKDNHFYYVPRISFQELFSASENILVTTACVGGVFGKGSEETQNKFLDFIVSNKDRCFFEIGHHMDAKQITYNRKMVELSDQTGVPLIAGTDTHVLNAEHEKGRSILQASKNIFFAGEENWDLKFKTYDELVEAYFRQSSIQPERYMEAIRNTNVMADMVEPFTLDRGTKYPHIYDNPEETFAKKIEDAIETHPYALKNHTREELDRVVAEEFAVYKEAKSIDFMLLQTYLREWEREHGIQCGYGRGSVSGSMIAYLLGITQMDSLRFGLNFFRFMNPSRVTNADIDTDYSGKDRDKIKQFLLRDKMNLPNIRSSEIITFNTIATKGAIRDVCRALYRDTGCRGKTYLEYADEICKEVDTNEESARKKFGEVFQYVDIISGTIVSIGTHPSGVLISDLPIDETLGLCSVSTSEYPVSMVNMKELDDLMYVKLDILGLDNIGVINDTCKMLGIERLTPDNTDLEDQAVWNSIRDDTTLIFQWESPSAQKYIRRFMSDSTVKKARAAVPNLSMIKWMSLGNGLLRPACASFRDAVADGVFYDNGFGALNDLLAPEAGRIVMQETIMRFLVEFCGYSQAESDNVRRAIAKKKGTETLLPEIEERFIRYCSAQYSMSREECEAIIKPFLQIILDASAYAFSWNHSDAYSAIGYICGYLRYYHPLEFLTAALNIFSDNQDKTKEITEYAAKRGIRVTMPKWGVSRSDYRFDREKNIISKGLPSIKFMSVGLAEELYNIAKSKTYERFCDVLFDLDQKSSINTRQLDILIKLDFFSDFGNQRELLRIADLFYNLFKRGAVRKINREKVDGTPLQEVVERNSTGITKSGQFSKSYTVLDPVALARDAEDAVKAVHMEDLSFTIKVRNFVDVMGYVGYSGKEEDRRKLYILSTKPATRRSDGRRFGTNIRTQSLGSGKESCMTIFNATFARKPVKAGDIIYCKHFDREGAFFRLYDYEIIL